MSKDPGQMSPEERAAHFEKERQQRMENDLLFHRLRVEEQTRREQPGYWGRQIDLPLGQWRQDYTGPIVCDRVWHPDGNEKVKRPAWAERLDARDQK